MKINIKMKRVALISLSVFLIGFIIMYNNVISKPLKTNEKMVSIEVKNGDGLYDVLNRLDEQGILNNKLLIKVKLSMDKQPVTLKEGIYEINSDVTLNELLKDLQDDSNNVSMVKITVPEGYSVEEIAQLMEDKGLCGKEEFIEAVKNHNLPDFIEVNEKRRYNLEGFLYPDTYLIEKGTSANNIIDKMLERFDKVIDEIERETGITINYRDIDKLITIASMIEKEASEDVDRPLISSVIYNRLDKEMKLQLDATVLYALGEHVDVVYNKHLEVDSPYNTYKYSGLPLGPIASPGIECIKAALLPAKTDYLYYILQKDGTHYFTDSYDDFLTKKKELGY
ncbi:endolytic transglycosylase MltG [uncultured Clostridium sp.]|uniref:endolytic transglycosylase MltG n=1 Tax=uncultured Clostridium sp. TaxID=59620 RepID=UPI0025E1D902|nr:endolytic transglycosylase MltG [uncultured Clostridium sp.]